MADEGAVATIIGALAPVQMENAGDTPEDRRRVLCRLVEAGEHAWWAAAALLASIDQRREWCDGHETLWDWYCDVVEDAGMSRPEAGHYDTFRRQVRNGYLWWACEAIGVPPLVLVRVGSSKADVVYRATRQALVGGKMDGGRLQGLLDDAAAMRRMDIARTLQAPQPQEKRGEGDGSGEDVDGDGESVATTPPLDATTEPPAPTPIPHDDRPSSTVKVTCPACGHVFDKEV